MKMRLLLPAGLLLAFAIPQRTSANLVSYWSGNDTAMDSVGGNDGVLTGSAGYTSAVMGDGFLFPADAGTDSGVMIPDAENLKITGSLSIRATIRIDGLPEPYAYWGQILFRGDDGPGLDPYYLAVSPQGELVFHVESLTASTKLFAPVPLGEFVDVLATLDDATGLMRVYVNGSVVGETTTDVRPLRNLDPARYPGLGIGNHSGIPGSVNRQPFTGVIDEVRLYNSVVPEPTSIVLLTSVLGLLAFGRRRVTTKLLVHRVTSMKRLCFAIALPTVLFGLAPPIEVDIVRFVI